MAQRHPFSQKVEFKSGETVRTLSTARGALQWAQREMAALEPLQVNEFRDDPQRDALHRGWFVPLADIAAKLAQFHSAESDATPEALADIERRLHQLEGAYNSERALLAEDERARIAIEVAETDVRASAFFLVDAMAGYSLQWVKQQPHMPSFLRGILLVEALRGRTLELIGPARTAVDALLKDASETIDDLDGLTADRQRQLDRFFQAIRRYVRCSVRHWREFRTSAEAELVELQALYRDQMALRPAADYWKRKADAHRKRVRGAVAAFCSTAVLGLGGLAGFYTLAVPFMRDATGALSIGAGLLLAVPALVLLGGLRLIGRSITLGIDNRDDATLRRTMVMTFLALKEDERAEVRREELLLVLQALFRPVGGGSSDDGPPASLMEAVVRAAATSRSSPQ